ncbi:hypothetical protein SMACR_12832 [Sordaria macrospora]|uniref:Uncharacterized protein n=1 Tax=Sordaria macrospora TaxID=5147 RepID=A0A8S9A2J6_SORMA|nr:hypothetical protein SMACR_12832 [Sordaria macrospora]WPJ65938.1 hypothetical protein SMAC4_12832 [Sordaria macrospora]
MAAIPTNRCARARLPRTRICRSHKSKPSSSSSLTKYAIRHGERQPTSTINHYLPRSERDPVC